MTTKSIATAHERNLVGSDPARSSEVPALGTSCPGALRRQRTRASFSTLGGLMLIFAGALFAPTLPNTAPQLLHLPFAAAALLGFAVAVNGVSNVIAKTRALRQVQSEADPKASPGAQNLKAQRQ